MKIGVDLGGSHIGVGLIYKDKIFESRQKNFVDEDRKDIKKTIIDSIIKMTNEVLEAGCIEKSAIEGIGIASPGLISKDSIVKARKFIIRRILYLWRSRRKIRLTSKNKK